MGTRPVGARSPAGLKSFEFGWWAHAELAVQAPMVEPVDVLQGGVFHVVEPAPGPAVADQLGLVQTVEGFRQGVIVAVAAGQRRAAVVVGLSTAGYEPLAPDDAAELISRALASGADGVALQMLPYWW